LTTHDSRPLHLSVFHGNPSTPNAIAALGWKAGPNNSVLSVMVLPSSKTHVQNGVWLTNPIRCCQKYVVWWLKRFRSARFKAVTPLFLTLQTFGSRMTNATPTYSKFVLIPLLQPRAVAWGVADLDGDLGRRRSRRGGFFFSFFSFFFC